MIEFDKVKVGDKLRVVGEKGPLCAKLGDIVTVRSVTRSGLGVRRAHRDGRCYTTFFPRAVSSARLEPIEEPAS